MSSRSNEEWLYALGERSGAARDKALTELREYLVRAALVYLSMHREELTRWSQEDIQALAEDMAQEAVMKVVANLASFKGASKFTTWAYRFVINLTASELRRRRYQDISLDSLRRDEVSAFAPLASGPDIVDPERTAQQNEYRNLVYNILQEELTERQRLALVGVYLRGYSMDEVATALGINRNALYKLLHDARKRLKQALQDRYITATDIISAFES